MAPLLRGRPALLAVAVRCRAERRLPGPLWRQWGRLCGGMLAYTHKPVARVPACLEGPPGPAGGGPRGPSVGPVPSMGEEALPKTLAGAAALSYMVKL
jgi:hypothetical protein